MTGGTLTFEELAPSLTMTVRSMLESYAPQRIPWNGAVAMKSAADLAARIDHTILKPSATSDEVRRVCQEALKHKFKSVCVNPCWVPLVSEMLAGSGVETCTVVGFPLGVTTTITKSVEAVRAIADGATEIDMVINQGEVASGRWDRVIDDIGAVVDAASGAVVKVIIETCYLNHNTKVGACLAAAMGGADFVKTSTGFGTGGATVDDVALMRLVVGGGLSVKASGGIRTTQDAMNMISAGADRVGASSSVSIIGL